MLVEFVEGSRAAGQVWQVISGGERREGGGAGGVREGDS